MCIISISEKIIPPPGNADITTIEGLIASMHLFQPKHFLFPFLAHALGTLFGALLTTLIAKSHELLFAFTIGIFFLGGGIINVLCSLLHSPMV
jgi:uncharacterized membrane protein HdeD (DUF308 family)